MPSQAGRAGVDVFFVISGFIMFHTTRDHSRTAPSFWRDRLIRIAPLYWFVTLIVTALSIAGFRPPGAERVDAVDVITSLAFFPTVSASGDWHPIINPGWTLIYEMYFYFLFGLTLFMKSQVWALAALIAFFSFGWLLAQSMPLPHAPTYYFSPIVFEFAAGGVLALLFNRSIVIPARTGRLIGYGLSAVGVVATVIAAAMFIELIDRSPSARTILFGGPAILIVAGALVLEKAGASSRSTALLFLGAASYAIYLCHDQVVAFTLRGFEALGASHTPVTQVAAAIVAITAGVGVGIALYLGFEKPVTKWLKSRARGSEPRGLGRSA